MSEKKYSNQPRKPQSIIDKIYKHGDTAINTMSAMIVGAGGYAANELRKQEKLS